MAGTTTRSPTIINIVIYTALAFLLLLFISRAPSKPSSHHRHRRLKLRSNFTFAHHQQKHRDPIPIPFDPLVADIERRLEDREWERQRFELNNTSAEWEGFIDAEDYVNDEDKFNVSGRLVLLFPRIDVDPVDGFVSEAELTDWNLHQAEREVMHRSQRELEVHDKNKDGFVSFSEYDPPSWVKTSENNSPYDMGWWKEEHFNASDVDGDGLLNITEFNDFLHPADSKNPKLLEWLCKEEIRVQARLSEAEQHTLNNTTMMLSRKAACSLWLAFDSRDAKLASAFPMDPDAVAKAFVEHYYSTFDANRAGLANLYQDNSMLTFEGQKTQGAQNIVAKLTGLPFQQCLHSVQTVDCQPSGPGGGMLVFVSGQIQLAGEQHGLKFSQMFHLMPTPQGSFYVQNDIFRLNYA